MRLLQLFLLIGFTLTSLQAAVGLTTVPNRDVVRMTIYNAVDLTLVQESRSLILKKGLNRIQYQWAGTLIDTTSLELRAVDKAADTDIVGIIYPPNSPATLIWEVESRIEGPATFEISYFTSGISWNADYVVRATPDETHADIEGWVAVTNNSGENYPRTEVRLVVGSINLIEQIRDLATGQLKERNRILNRTEFKSGRGRNLFERAIVVDKKMIAEELSAKFSDKDGAPEVVSARLGDYHIFTVSGVQTITHRATARFQAINNKKPLPIEVLYRVGFMENEATKLYRFINDTAHELPIGPLPDGQWHIFQVTDAKTKTLSYSGTTNHDYVPPDQKVELDLGIDSVISIKQVHLSHIETNHHFNNDGRIDGWITHDRFAFTLVNTKTIPVSVEYLVYASGRWSIHNLAGERRDETTHRHQAQVAAGETLDLGPFTVSVGTNKEPTLQPPEMLPLPDIKSKP